MTLYRYLSWLYIHDYSGEHKEIFLALGKKETEKCYVEPFVPGICEVLEIIKLPYLMTPEEAHLWTKENLLEEMFNLEYWGK